MTSKVSRNDPCPCGSGKKYKKCCLEKDQAAERAAFAQVAAKAAAKTPVKTATSDPARVKALREAFDEAQALDNASNAVVDLVHAGKLDEAEQAARELLERYPHVPDGHERLGLVYEARGDQQRAAESYRSCLQFIRAHPGDFEPEYEQFLLSKLDPPSPN